MQRQMLKSKIHRATVTDCDVDYVGSITIDPELMASADLLPNEQVHVWDIDNGARFVTYAIEGEPGSGDDPGQRRRGAPRPARVDKVIVASFGAYDERDLETYAPIVVHVDDDNEVARSTPTPRSCSATRAAWGPTRCPAPSAATGDGASHEHRTASAEPRAATGDAPAAGGDEARRASRS